MVGGHDGSTQLSSTEVLVSGSNSWQFIAPYPEAAQGMKTIQYGGTILSFGKIANLSLKPLSIKFFKVVLVVPIYINLKHLLKHGVLLVQ